jgi:hypothetical protein
MTLKNLIMIGVAVVFLQSLIACSPNKSPPEQHEVRRFIEVTLFRQAAMPIKNVNIKESHLSERAGITFHCVSWDAELVWDYPKGNNKQRVFGYVRYVKTPEGWGADHVNYKQAPEDPKLECETIPLSGN